jgi:DNA invertase Pin-like site-specific DNA recombinase
MRTHELGSADYMGGDFVGSIAAFERELVRARTSEGRARAKLRGVRFGRKPKLTAHQIQEALARRQAALADMEGATTSVIRSVDWDEVSINRKKIVLVEVANYTELLRVFVYPDRVQSLH